MALMCAYKLCRVEFRYWGMQTKLEKFIHDVGECCLYFILFYISFDQNMSDILNNLIHIY